MRLTINWEGLVPLRLQRLVVASTLGLVAGLIAAGSATAASFTAEQAAAGQTAYNTNCARCHGFQLEGPDAPGLAGSDVMQNWDTAGGLYDFISVAMPPENPGGLGEEAYINIVAYIMSFNGAQPGDEPMVAGDGLYDISLAAETAAAPAPAADAPASADAASPSVPQAFTWGKQLPGGPPPATTTTQPAAPAVPQAFTWGKQLPQVNAPSAQ